MATADQIKSLIHSHFSDELERFYSIALQVAAHEAMQGHTALAQDIRQIVDSQRNKKHTKVIPFPNDLKGLVFTEESSTSLSDMVTSKDIHERLTRIIHEYLQRDKLKAHGLKPRSKILLIGSPGTGKTMTAKVLSKELHLNLHTIQVDRLVTKFMGETSAKLRQIFDMIQSEQGVYLFDEFDAIGGDRSNDNDVGEMRRVLNAFLQFIEQNTSDSLIIAATNNPKLLDHALFRRFDDVLYYETPDLAQRKSLITNLLSCFMTTKFSWHQVLKISSGLSHSEIDHACRDAIKNAILADIDKVSAKDLFITLQERQATHKGTSG